MFTYSNCFCGDEYTTLIDINYNLWCFGNNIFDRDTSDPYIKIPTQIFSKCNIKMISGGFAHVICCDFEGNLYSCGNNYHKQLGRETNENFSTFGQVNIPHVLSVSCGNYFSICIIDDNTVYSFGSGEYGALGTGFTFNCITPTQIPDLYDIEIIECGGKFVISKSYSGEYYVWGSGKKGVLGTEDNKIYKKPKLCSSFPDNIISIKSGENHTLLLTLEGYVYSFGRNNYGQLGINNKNIKSTHIPTLINDIPQIKRIECGYDHSMCIDINDNLLLFGYNDYGQLGLGDKEHRYKPIIHPKLSNIIDISSGGDHTFVKTIDNKIYAFGHNNTYQLGIIITSEINPLSPIQVFQDNSDIWLTTINKSKAKSARK